MADCVLDCVFDILEGFVKCTCTGVAWLGSRLGNALSDVCGKCGDYAGVIVDCACCGNIRECVQPFFTSCCEHLCDVCKCGGEFLCNACKACNDCRFAALRECCHARLSCCCAIDRLFCCLCDCCCAPGLGVGEIGSHSSSYGGHGGGGGMVIVPVSSSCGVGDRPPPKLMEHIAHPMPGRMYVIGPPVEGDFTPQQMYELQQYQMANGLPVSQPRLVGYNVPAPQAQPVFLLPLAVQIDEQPRFVQHPYAQETQWQLQPELVQPLYVMQQHVSPPPQMMADVSGQPMHLASPSNQQGYMQR